MSYCRWSPVCDVYVYEDVAGGWTTHLAGRMRMKHPEGKPYPDFDFTSVESITESLARQQEWRNEAEYEDTGLPAQEDNYNHNTPGECAENLLRLKGIGYQVPQHAIDVLLREQDEMS